MLIPVVIAIGSALAVGAAFEFVKHRKANAAAVTAAANAQTLQQPAAAATGTPDPTNIAAIAAAAAAQAVADSAAGSTGSSGQTSNLSVPAQAVQAAQQAQQAASVTVGPAQDSNLTFDPATGLNKDRNLGGTSQDPSVVNTIANVLGI